MRVTKQYGISRLNCFVDIQTAGLPIQKYRNSASSSVDSLNPLAAGIAEGILTLIAADLGTAKDVIDP
jgi:hypothetical protein